MRAVALVLLFVLFLSPAVAVTPAPSEPLEGKYGCADTITACGTIHLVTTCRQRTIYAAEGAGAAAMDWEFSVAVLTNDTDPPTTHLLTVWSNGTVAPRFRETVVHPMPVWFAIGALHARDPASGNPSELVSYWWANC